jgi:excisionase family DNA binding protein
MFSAWNKRCWDRLARLARETLPKLPHLSLLIPVESLDIVLAIMTQELYSVEKVAELLGLHVKTVRSYVREGRLKAVRIGKQYRIAGEDLAVMTGRPAASFKAEPVRRHRHVEVSSIVEIDAVSPETANRLTTVLISAADGIRIETIYDESRGRMKIILVGSMDHNASYFKLISAVLE